MTFEKKYEMSFHCPRVGGMVNENTCYHCRHYDEAISAMKWRAEIKGIDWANQPCPWECGKNPSKKFTPLTVEKSIEVNHWKNHDLSEKAKKNLKLIEQARDLRDAKTKFAITDIDKKEGIVDSKECQYCDDFDSKKYHLMLRRVSVFEDCFKLKFDINDHKSVRFEMIEDINIAHVLTQQRNSCLWSKTLPNFLVKYYNTGEPCDSENEKIDLVDVHIYLEKISKTRWYFSISADGGFDLFASIISSEEGKCLGTVEFLNELTEDYPFRETDFILQNQSAKRAFSTGRAIGYEGIALVSCGEDN